MLVVKFPHAVFRHGIIDIESANPFPIESDWQFSVLQSPFAIKRI
ncbi:MAG: hypothetical protein ABSF90_12525 [Syntrophobacteraceae bacterium]|jgi:hypothetical protein